jgi:hypothetical protein
MARRALVGIGTGYRASGNAAMRETVEEQADRSGPLRAVALELLLNSHIARSNSKAGLQAADALQQQFAGTEHAAYAQVNRYFLHARAGDRAAAKQALSTFTENHAAEQGRAARRADLARWLLLRQEDGTSEAKPKRKHATADQTANATPDQFAATSYPNPFQQQATIQYELPERRRVRLTVYDALSSGLLCLTPAQRDREKLPAKNTRGPGAYPSALCLITTPLRPSPTAPRATSPCSAPPAPSARRRSRSPASFRSASGCAC